jgi:ankyrin repeat protein
MERKQPRVEYRLRPPLHGDEDLEPDGWPLARELAADVAGLVRAYLAVDGLSCCTLQGGFLIYADGALWNRSAIDEVTMSSSWLPAVEQLLRGEATAGVWAWEESSMTLARRGDDVELGDVHHSGSVVCPLVRFDLRAFAAGLAEAAAPVARLVEAMQVELDVLEAAAAAEEQRERIDVLRHNFLADWSGSAARVAALARGELPPVKGEALPAVHRAIWHDDREAVRAALAADATALYQRWRGETTLHAAVRYRRAAIAHELLERGADPDERCAYGSVEETPLHMACSLRQLALIELLVEHGADVSAPNGHGASPLQLASRRCFRQENDVVRTLLARGAALDLPAAIMLGRRADAERLAAGAGAYPDLFALWVEGARGFAFSQDDADPQAVTTALADEWRDTLATLVRAGGDVDGVSPASQSPALLVALLGDDEALVRLMLALGADPDARAGGDATVRERAEQMRLRLAGLLAR